MNLVRNFQFGRYKIDNAVFQFSAKLGELVEHVYL